MRNIVIIAMCALFALAIGSVGIEPLDLSGASFEKYIRPDLTTSIDVGAAGQTTSITKFAADNESDGKPLVNVGKIAFVGQTWLNIVNEEPTTSTPIFDINETLNETNATELI